MKKYFLFVSLLCVVTPFLVPQEKPEVLVLAHGGSSDWQELVANAVAHLRGTYPTEIAFGMADPAAMQRGIDNLEAVGVTRIVAVPLFISSHSPIIRQNEYLLGLRKKLADPPMLMQHSSGTHSNHHDSMAAKIGLPAILPLRTRCKVTLVRPLDDNPLVAQILDERIKELSQEPHSETVILVAHGPNDEEDNRLWVKTMEGLADQISRRGELSQRNYKQIFCVTVRDDAKKEVHDQAKEHLRSLVQQSGKNGDVIVIPLFLAQGGVESKIVERLEGLKYKWSGKTLLPHTNISRFLEESVKVALH